MSYQPYLKIDLKKVEDNIKTLSQGKKVCLMVKADQYHVLPDIGPLVNMGYDFFGVSTPQEAKVIREKFDVNVLIVAKTTIAEINSNNDEKIIYTIAKLEDLKDVNPNQKIHINFDTGMGRIGLKSKEVRAAIKIIKERKLNVDGIYTHFPCASDQEYTNEQIARFKTIVDEFKDHDVNVRLIHAQNSTGALLYEMDFCNMVRPGIGIWGYSANAQEVTNSPLKPALSLIAPIALIKDYTGPIGYDHIEEVSGKIATINLGYNDGLQRSLQGYNFGPARIVGKICMCQTMVQLSEEIRELTIFSEAQLYDLCEYMNISVYEFLCGLSWRIARKIMI